MPVPNGVVKWFDPDRGVGVITPDGAAPDAVAYRSAILRRADRTLVEGERVLFDLTQDSTGIRADNIHRLPPGTCCPREEGSAEHTHAGPPADRLAACDGA
ncbi:cold-shock protein [Streptomyces sp. SAS_270]|uniref:cold-shock protein n=1 Tax=Streptomyces sp. SAS_270 TaxID=3412748 RepID=UPI00403C7AF1